VLVSHFSESGSFLLTSTSICFYSFIHICIEADAFVYFVSRQGRNLLVNIKDISFALQNGVFCEIHIRGIEVMWWWKMTLVRFTER
ncbi:hypothetical protein O5553_28335, partial [Escherichia coli]|nr:hypothetical protein [Escherichia coli]